jgi:hypothetical protein
VSSKPGAVARKISKSSGLALETVACVVMPPEWQEAGKTAILFLPHRAR